MINAIIKQAMYEYFVHSIINSPYPHEKYRYHLWGLCDNNKEDINITHKDINDILNKAYESLHLPPEVVDFDY